MPEERLQPGDLVILKTEYSPNMVIESIQTTTELASCVWFDGDHLPHHDKIYTPALKRAQEGR